MAHDIWSPAQYAAHADHRKRPFYELLARVGADDPRYVVDLGCGPGELTAELARRWPGATVEGIDSSASMIATACRLEDARLAFRLGDIATWQPSAPADVIVSNAALQWVPGHEDLLPGWVEALPAGGWLAFAVPANFSAPSHVLLRELCVSVRWHARLAGALRHGNVCEPGHYLELLTRLGCEADVWETTYQQVLKGPDAVLEWTKGTALRPALDMLGSDAEREEFTAAYRELLAGAYPERSQRTVFPFRRIFVVARKTP